MSGASRVRQIMAATIGNAMEWYDFQIFGYMTPIVSRLFFPSYSEYGALLAAAATFGVGFFMRPVGGVVLGVYADRYGRRAALQAIIGITTVAMAMMAFAPTYAAVGVAAPLLMVVARLLQGFATGGEFASSTAFLVESAPRNRQGLYGSWQAVGQFLAMIAASGAGALVTRTMSVETIDAGGWRIPFLLGILIAPIGLWMRRHIEEPETYVRAHRKAGKAPLREVLTHHRRAVAVCVALTAAGTVPTYVMTVYMPTFAYKHLGIPLDQAFTALCLSAVFVTLLVPVFGALSDRVGRKPLLSASLWMYAVVVWPAFWWLTSHPGYYEFLLVLTVLSAARLGYAGAMSTVLAEQFPVAVRSTGMSVAYNVAVMAFGGSAQLVVTWLVEQTGTPLVVPVYLMVASIIGAVATWFAVEPSRDQPDEDVLDHASQPPLAVLEDGAKLEAG